MNFECARNIETNRITVAFFCKFFSIDRQQEQISFIVIKLDLNLRQKCAFQTLLLCTMYIRLPCLLLTRLINDFEFNETTGLGFEFRIFTQFLTNCFKKSIFFCISKHWIKKSVKIWNLQCTLAGVLYGVKQRRQKVRQKNCQKFSVIKTYTSDDIKKQFILAF